MGKAPRRKSFLRNVATLATGAAAAQVLNLAITPVLSRMYSPEDFGVLGLLSSFVALFIGVAALRYDMAIVLPKEDDDAAATLGLSIFVVCGMATLCLVCVALAGDLIADLFGAAGLGAWLWLGPLFVLGAGLFNVFTYWCTRRKAFGRASVAAVVAAVASAGTKVAGGFAQLGAIGLVMGQVLGQSVAALVLGRQVKTEDGEILQRAFRRERMKAMARRYREFPLFHAPMTFVSKFGQNLPVYALGASFGPAVVGQWALATMLLQRPVSIVANSVRQVLFQRMTEELNQGGDVPRLLRRATLGLLAIGIGPVLLGMWIAPWVFTTVLGDQWVEAGLYARYALPWQLIALVSSPANALFPVLRMQRTVLYHQLTTVAAGFLSLWLGARWGGASGAVIAYSGMRVVAGVALIVLVAWTARHGTASDFSDAADDDGGGPA